MLKNDHELKELLGTKKRCFSKYLKTALYRFTPLSSHRFEMKKSDKRLEMLFHVLCIKLSARMIYKALQSRLEVVSRIE